MSVPTMNQLNLKAAYDLRMAWQENASIAFAHHPDVLKAFVDPNTPPSPRNPTKAGFEIADGELRTPAGTFRMGTLPTDCSSCPVAFQALNTRRIVAIDASADKSSSCPLRVKRFDGQDLEDFEPRTEPMNPKEVETIKNAWKAFTTPPPKTGWAFWPFGSK